MEERTKDSRVGKGEGQVMYIDGMGMSGSDVDGGGSGAEESVEFDEEADEASCGGCVCPCSLRKTAASMWTSTVPNLPHSLLAQCHPIPHKLTQARVSRPQLRCFEQVVHGVDRAQPA